jgi:OmpA family
MYIWERRGLGEYTFSEPQPATPSLRSKPPYLRYFNLDGFEWNKHSLTLRLQNLIGHLAKMVESSLTSTQPIGAIHLIGHTDNTGPESYNVGLGNRRAQAVADELAKFKGLVSRVAIVIDPSPGKSMPVADNRTKEGRAANRRVEVFVTTAAVSPTTSPTGRKDWRKEAEEAARRIEEEAERRRQEQIYNRPVPVVPPGRSISDWLDERLARLPQWLRTRIRDAILKGACALLDSLLAQAVGQLSDKEKEDLRTICLEQAKRPIR